MFDEFQGKRILVTGASTGIGAAVAKRFGALGAHVAVHYNTSEAPAREVVEAIERAGGQAFTLQQDVSTAEGAVAVVDRAAERLGGLDILVNNAGDMLGRVPAGDIEASHYARVMDLNVRSVTLATRAALAHFRRQGEGGNIINTTSVAARNGGGPGASLYASAKAFVSSFTRGMAKELAGDGVRVNAVAPGVIVTPFHDRHSSDAQLEAMRAGIPMGRLGTPEECVGAFLFLASDAMSGYVTGQILEVNGGQLMP